MIALNCLAKHRQVTTGRLTAYWKAISSSVLSRMVSTRRRPQVPVALDSAVQTGGTSDESSKMEIEAVKVVLPDAGKLEETKIVLVKAEVEPSHLSGQPKTKTGSRRKRKSETSGKEDPEVASESVIAAGKVVVKKPKRLKETAHSEEDLPAVRLKADKILKQLMEIYVDPPCPLDHANAFQLLCSVILSAQSTDKKVNEIVPPLYKLAPTAFEMAKLEAGVIEEHIRQIGLAPTKAKSISKMSQALVERHDGQVPDTFEALEQLAGVGHKTASVVLAVAFKQPTFPVDTHIFRLGLRWGLTSGDTVEQAEADLKVCWPEEHWNALHLRLIYFGREHCLAQRHDPTACPICSWASVPPYNVLGQSPARAGSRKLAKGEMKKPKQRQKVARKKLELEE